MSAPHSASSMIAVRSDTPGIVVRRFRTGRKGSAAFARVVSMSAIAASRKSTWASICATSSPWWVVRNRPANASRRAGILLRSPPRASSASACGSLSPASRASSIARPDFVSSVDATLVNLIPASCSTFSNR